MSHNVKVTGVAINDIDCLIRAVNEVSREKGIPMILHERKQQVGWQGRLSPKVYPYVLSIAGCPFEIAFEEENGTYTPLFDQHGGYISKVLGRSPESKSISEDGTYESVRSAADDIGQLLQAYTVVRLEQEVMMKGLQSYREVCKDTGQIRLTVTGY